MMVFVLLSLLAQESELSKKRKECENLEHEVKKRQKRCLDLVSNLLAPVFPSRMLSGSAPVWIKHYRSGAAVTMTWKTWISSALSEHCLVVWEQESQLEDERGKNEQLKEETDLLRRKAQLLDQVSVELLRFFLQSGSQFHSLGNHISQFDNILLINSMLRSGDIVTSLERSPVSCLWSKISK